MSHVSASKALCGGLASALLALAVTGCSSTGAPTSEAGDRLGSHGVTAVVPASWHRIPLGHLPGAIVPLQVASFPARGAVQSICDPHSIVKQIPVGGVLLQILQDGGSTSRKIRKPGAVSRAGPPSDYRSLAKPFRLEPPQSHECGEAYNVFFRKGGSVLQLRIWTAPGGPSRTVRRQIQTLMDSLRVH
jgi:hypothetical protein